MRRITWIFLPAMILAACAAPAPASAPLPATLTPVVPAAATATLPPATGLGVIGVTAGPDVQPLEPPGGNILTPADCTRFAAPDGSDSADGSEAAPWATLQQAAAAAQPGDTVCFRTGLYLLSEAVRIETSGTEGDWITFAAYPGDGVTFDGQGQASGIFDFAPDASYIRLSSVALTGFTIWGINVPGGNHDLMFDHMDISGGEAGIHFTLGNSGEDPEYGPVEWITVEDSIIHDVLYTAVDCTPGPCNEMTFQRLEIYGAGMQGQEASFGADGLAVERGSSIRVMDSAIHDNGGDGIDLNSRDTQGLQGYPNGYVRGNQVYRNRLQGIKLWAGGAMIGNAVWGQGINPVMVGVFPGDYNIQGNTIAYNMWDPSYSGRDYAVVIGYPETGESAAINLSLTDNIFAFNTGPEVGTPTGIYLGEGVTIVEEGGNLFYSREDCEIEANNLPDRADPCMTWAEIESDSWVLRAGDPSLVGDPLFVSGWPNVDLHLQAGSPGSGSIGAYDWEGP